MAVNNRAKRVTDPLDANVRARLRGEVTGYGSSGSDHDAAPCLSGLVHAFLLQNPPSSEDDGGDLEEREREGEEEEEEEEEEGGAADRAAAAAEEAWLRRGREGGAAAFRRAAMARLRAAGYDAGICKARLEGPGVSAGSYEYIDVVVAASEKNVKGSSRYIVDAEVAAGLEVARATEGYGRVVGAVPALVVARAEAVGGRSGWRRRRRGGRCGARASTSPLEEAPLLARQVARPLPQDHQPLALLLLLLRRRRRRGQVPRRGVFSGGFERV
uniref:Uncharacterized protein n=1 Tax=Ananas comosus var. bracteatus TaxID=296719 RepID=A0A6V7QYG5_ANACO